MLRGDGVAYEPGVVVEEPGVVALERSQGLLMSWGWLCSRGARGC